MGVIDILGFVDSYPICYLFDGHHRFSTFHFALLLIFFFFDEGPLSLDNLLRVLRGFFLLVADTGPLDHQVGAVSAAAEHSFSNERGLTVKLDIIAALIKYVRLDL